MRTDRDLPFLFPPGFPAELRGAASDPLVAAVAELVDGAVRRIVLPFLFAAEEPDAAVAFEEAVAAFGERRDALLDRLESALTPAAIGEIRRHAVAFAARTFRDAPWGGPAPSPTMRALAHCELLTELAVACPAPRSAAHAADLRRHAVRLELGLFGALCVAGGRVSGGRADRTELLVTSALLAARRVHALLMGVSELVRSDNGRAVRV